MQVMCQQLGGVKYGLGVTVETQPTTSHWALAQFGHRSC